MSDRVNRLSRRHLLQSAGGIALGLGVLAGAPARADETITYLFPAPPLLPAFGPISDTTSPSRTEKLTPCTAMSTPRLPVAAKRIVTLRYSRRTTSDMNDRCCWADCAHIAAQKASV